MNLPQHIAITPDGNRRWAKERGLKPWEGHREGMRRFVELSEAAFEAGISYFTFWAASEDNLTKRTPLEVKFLLMVIRDELERQLDARRFVELKVRVRVIGRWRALIADKKTHRMVERLEQETAGFTERRLTILFGYDGRREMVEAIKKITAERPKRLDYDTVHKALWTHDLPPVDFAIRTGGEPHWSAGFMMWLTAYSQFYFTETYFPAFTPKELQKALAEYARRERRFGK